MSRKRDRPYGHLADPDADGKCRECGRPTKVYYSAWSSGPPYQHVREASDPRVPRLIRRATRDFIETYRATLRDLA